MMTLDSAGEVNKGMKMLASIHSGTRLAGRAIVFDAALVIALLLITVFSQSVWFQDHPNLMFAAIGGDLLLTFPVLTYLAFWRSNRVSVSLALLFFLEFLFLLSLFNPVWDFLVAVSVEVKLAGFFLTLFGFFLSSTVSVLQIAAECRHHKNKANQTLDRTGSFRASLESVAGSGWFSNLIACELATFSFFIGPNLAKTWFGFSPRKSFGFSYHKKSNIGILLSCLGMVLVMEITAVHFLVSGFSHLVAWLLSASSLYVAYQLVAHYRSLSLTNIEIDENFLCLRNGILFSSLVSIDQIESIEASKKIPSDQKDSFFFSLPASHNMILELREPQKVHMIYGSCKEVKRILFFVDEPEMFEQEMHNLLNLSP